MGPEASASDTASAGAELSPQTDVDALKVKPGALAAALQSESTRMAFTLIGKWRVTIGLLIVVVVFLAPVGPGRYLRVCHD
jgi:hypothetical protein